MKNEKKTYIMRVRYALRGLRIYKIETTDIYHIIGKLYCNSIEHIERIDYSIYTENKDIFWRNLGYKIETENPTHICGVSCALYNSLGCPYACGEGTNVGKYCDEWRCSDDEE